MPGMYLEDWRLEDEKRPEWMDPEIQYGRILASETDEEVECLQGTVQKLVRWSSGIGALIVVGGAAVFDFNTAVGASLLVLGMLLFILTAMLASLRFVRLVVCEKGIRMNVSKIPFIEFSAVGRVVLSTNKEGGGQWLSVHLRDGKTHTVTGSQRYGDEAGPSSYDMIVDAVLVGMRMSRPGVPEYVYIVDETKNKSAGAGARTCRRAGPSAAAGA